MELEDLSQLLRDCGGKKWAHARGNITSVSHRAQRASRSGLDYVSIVYWRASAHSGADLEVTPIGRSGSEVNTQR